MAQQPSRYVLEWIKQQYAGADEATRKARRAKVKPRNSLEDVLRHDPVASGRLPEQISLPESKDESSTAGDIPDGGIDPRERDANAAKSSLEMIDRDGTLVLPALIPLPPSPPPRSPTQEPSQPLQPYKNVLDRAADVFDHIKNGNIRKASRVEQTTITLYEYWDNNTFSTVEIRNTEGIPLYRRPAFGLRRRVFIVEDLSKGTIHALGEAFSLTPEFFEEHLLNSGYAGPKYDHPPARQWKTAGFTKSYVSIQWFRPMYRRPPLFSVRDREDLLDLEGDGLKFVSGNSTISLEAETNIFRSEWDLCVDPRATAKETREIGLVERASICMKNAEDLGYEAVIVLLDPLPTIRVSYDKTLQIPKKSAGVDNDRVNVNESHDHDGHDDGHGYNNESLDGTATLSARIMQGDGNFEELATPYQTPRRDTTERPTWELLLKRAKRRFDRGRVNVRTSFQVLVKQMTPRKPITIDLEQAMLTGESLTMLQEELNETRSTRQEIHDTLARKDISGDLLNILFKIICQDTSKLLQVLHQILSDMEIDILDDMKMEDRLAMWRQLIRKADRELSELKVSTKGFLDFIGVSHSTVKSFATEDDNTDLTMNMLNFFEEIDEMLERLRRASASLTSNMGILDSRRSINEAHAVTRLTELAFIFIPLSFSTSFFGMQIEPFKDPVPLWNFFIVAITVTTFAYLMRLTMRSQWLSRTKQEVKQDVRRYAEQRGLPVQIRSLSMLLLLQWFGSVLKRRGTATWLWTVRRSHQVGSNLGSNVWRIIGFPIGFIMVIGIVALAPIAVLWARDLDRGVQGGVTVVIILSVVGLVGIPYWRYCGPEFRYAFPKHIMGLVKRISPTVRTLLLWALGTVILVAIPLLLIWTSPLASGIKASLTAAILVILFAGIGTLGIYNSTWILRRWFFEVQSDVSAELF